MTATVRLYFRNIMFFVHHGAGTDIWFLGGHEAHVFTQEQVVSIEGAVVRMSGGETPRPGGEPIRLDLPRVISFNTLAPDGRVSDDIRNRTLSDDLVARVELSAGGTLRDMPSVHSYGVLLDWSTPTLGGDAHVQRLTEVAVYEVPDVRDPVLVVSRGGRQNGGDEHIRLPVTTSGGARIAEAFFLAGELPKAQRGVTEREDQLVIGEFDAFHRCFEPETRARMGKVIPTARKPRNGFNFRSAEPFCPNAQIDLRIGG